MSTIVRETQAPAVTERERRARTLEAAALEIEVRGWVRFSICDGAGQVCLVGALGAAQGLTLAAFRDDSGLWDDAAAAFTGNGNDQDATDLVWRWNDSWALSGDDVTFLLRWRAEEIRDGR